MEKEHLEEQENKNVVDEGLSKEEAKSESETASEDSEKEADSAETDETSEEIDELEKLNAELAESKDKYLRLYSEFENFRRRTAKERLELISTANESLILSLLPIIDDFERAIESNKNAEIETVKEGFNLIHNKFNNILEQKGLKPMENKQGIEFNPEIHEAITQIPAPKKKLEGKVVDTIEKGYYLGEKVIRFAKVVIGAKNE